MQPDSGNGTGLGPTGEAPIVQAPPISGEVSSTAEELNAKIEQELGLPHTEVTPNADDKPADIQDNGATPPEDLEEEQEIVAKDVPKPGDEPKPAEPVAETDLFIEVEDVDGNKYKITSLDDLPEDFQYKNSRQPLEIFKGLTKLESQIEAQTAAAAELAATEAETAAQTAKFESWDKEIASLAKEKRIDAKDQDRISKVFEHIGKINQERAKNGNPNLITSFEDGLDKYERVEANEKETDKQKQENERAKIKSSLIGGGSSAVGSAYRPYYSGSAKNMDDVIV